MAVTRQVMQYTVTLGVATSTIEARVKISDETEMIERIEAFRVSPVPVTALSPLETAVLALDTQVISALGTMFAAKNFTRPLKDV